MRWDGGSSGREEERTLKKCGESGLVISRQTNVTITVKKCGECQKPHSSAEERLGQLDCRSAVKTLFRSGTKSWSRVFSNHIGCQVI